MNRLKILVSAYACEPGKGSEPGVGWNWVKQLARFHDVWVLTRTNNREPIERALAQEPMANVHWVYFDLPRWARFWKKGRRGVHLYYYLWQIGAYFVGRRLHNQVKFDLVHHITFDNFIGCPVSLCFCPCRLYGGLSVEGSHHLRRFIGVSHSEGKSMSIFATWHGGLVSMIRL